MQCHTPLKPRPRPGLSRPRSLALWLAAGALGGAPIPPAQAFGGLLLLDPAPSETKLAVGASSWTAPHDPGARPRTWLLPGLDCYAPSGLFLSTDYGLGWNASTRSDVQAGLRLSPHFGRSHQAAAAAGAPQAAIRPRWEKSAFFNLNPNPALLLQSALRQGAGRPRRSARAGRTCSSPSAMSTASIRSGGWTRSGPARACWARPASRPWPVHATSAR